MSSLAFISTTGSSGADPAVPAESPFDAALAQEGAHFDLRDGWRIAARVGGPEDETRWLTETVGWCDVSHLGKLELQSAPDGAPAIAGLAGGLEMGTAVRHRDAWWCQVTPLRALVACEAADTRALHAELDDIESVHVVDVTTQFSALRIVGPLSRELLARFCALDLRDHATPVGALRPGSVARTPGYVLREQGDRYLVLLGAAYALHHWEVVSDAGRRLGGGPVGIDALNHLSPDSEESRTHA